MDHYTELLDSAANLPVDGIVVVCVSHTIRDPCLSSQQISNYVIVVVFLISNFVV